jgi:hypothetical protein
MPAIVESRRRAQHKGPNAGRDDIPAKVEDILLPGASLEDLRRLREKSCLL